MVAQQLLLLSCRVSQRNAARNSYIVELKLVSGCVMRVAQLCQVPGSWRARNHYSILPHLVQPLSLILCRDNASSPANDTVVRVNTLWLRDSARPRLSPSPCTRP